MSATVVLDVPTIHCRSCQLNIEESLDELAGVAGRRVDVEAKRVSVDYDPAIVDRHAIVATIEAAGYPVAS